MIFSLGLWVACSSGEIPTDTSPTLDSVGDRDTNTDTQTVDTQTVDTGKTDTGPCDPLPATPGQDHEMTLDQDGVERTFLLRLPADYDCTPRPLLIGLHGYYGSGAGFSHDTADLQDHLDQEGYIGLFPDGLSMSKEQSRVTSFNDLGSRYDEGPDGPTCQDDAWDYGAFDNCGESERTRACHWGTSCADTEGLIRLMLQEVMEDWTVDSQRIYLTGFSQGGQTAQSMACPLADILAAVAPIHGFSANGYTCGPTTPLPMMQVWGTRDRIVPGDDGQSSDGYLYEDAAETAAIWAQAQGCDTDGSTPHVTEADGKKDWTCTQHDNCSSGAEVVTCSWDGAHIWSKAGKTGNFVLESIWTFFEAHPRSD